MNRIVRAHFPVEKLPAELKRGLPDGALVTVTVETEPTRRRRGGRAQQSPMAFFAQFKDIRRASFARDEDVLAHVGGLRDERSD